MSRRARKTPCSWLKEEEDKLTHLYNNGYSAKQIANTGNFEDKTEGQIRNKISNLGLTRDTQPAGVSKNLFSDIIQSIGNKRYQMNKEEQENVKKRQKTNFHDEVVDLSEEEEEEEYHPTKNPKKPKFDAFNWVFESDEFVSIITLKNNNVIKHQFSIKSAKELIISWKINKPSQELLSKCKVGLEDIYRSSCELKLEGDTIIYVKKGEIIQDLDLVEKIEPEDTPFVIFNIKKVSNDKKLDF